MHSYLLPYLKIVQQKLPIGSKIFLHTWEKKRFELSPRDKRITQSDLKQQSIEWIDSRYSELSLFSYVRFANMIFKLSILSIRKKINVLHPFAPGAGLLALFVHYITAKKIVMDSWEPHAESMVESGVWKQNSLAFRIQFWAERKLAHRSHYLIAATRTMIEYSQLKWKITPSKIAFRPACVDLNLFDKSNFNREEIRKELHLSDKLVCVCVGKLTGMYMGLEVFHFFKAALDFFGEQFCVLLLTETFIVEIETLCRISSFPIGKCNIYQTSHQSVPYYLAAADFAINPQKPIPSKRYGTPVKDGEYWAMGLPIVIPPQISEDSMIVVSENVGVIWTTKIEDNLSTLKLLNELLLDNGHGDRCLRVAKKYRDFSIAQKAYKLVYNSDF